MRCRDGAELGDGQPVARGRGAVARFEQALGPRYLAQQTGLLGSQWRDCFVTRLGPKKPY